LKRKKKLAKKVWSPGFCSAFGFELSAYSRARALLSHGLEIFKLSAGAAEGFLLSAKKQAAIAD
jgi:hypothetical protein